MTTALAPSAPSIAKRPRSVPLWPLHVAALFALALQFWRQRFPGSQPQSYTAWVVLWILYFSALIINVSLALKGPLDGPKKSIRSRVVLLRWLILPGLAWFMAFASQHDLPFRAAFLYSRSALTRLAQQTLAAPLATTYPAQNIGLFHATDVYALPNETGFLIYGSRGLIYAPDGQPAARNRAIDRDSIEPLGGDWYEFLTSSPLDYKHRRDQAALLEALAAGDPKAAASIPGLIDSLSDDYWGNSNDERYAEYATGVRIPQNTLSNQIATPQSSEYNLLRPDIRALVRLGPVAVPALVARLTASPLPSIALRQRIVQTLAITGPDASAAVPALTSLLHDPESILREFAAWSLCEIGPAAHTAIPDLLTTLNDPDLCVRFNTILVLRRLHPDSAFALPAYAHFVHALLTDPPVAIPHRPTLPPNYYDRRDLNSENYVNIYEHTMAESLDAIAEYGPGAASIAPSLAADLHESYSSPLFHQRNELPARQFTSEQSAVVMMYTELRQKVPSILNAVGPAGHDAAPELDLALRAAMSNLPDFINTYHDGPWPITHSLAAVARGYQPSVDYIMSEFLSAQAKYIEMYALDPSNSQNYKSSWRAQYLAMCLESIDPNNAAMHDFLNADTPATIPASDRKAQAEKEIHARTQSIFLTSDPSTLAGIIDRLNHPLGRNTVGLLHQLNSMGKAAVPAIPAVLDALSPWQGVQPGYPEAALDFLANLGPSAWQAVPFLQSVSPGNDNYPAAQHALAAIDRNQPEITTLRQTTFVQDAQKLTGLKLTSTDAAIDALIARLNSGNPSRETQLLASLGPAAHHAIPALLALLPLNPNSNSPREFAAEALAKIAPPDAQDIIPQIVHYLQNPRCRMDITILLSNLGSAAAPYLRPGLTDDNPYVRYAAIDGLLKMGPATIPDLPAILKAANRNTLNAMDLFLDRLPSLHAPPALVLPELESLLQSSPDLRLRAAIALGNMGKDALPARAQLEQRKLGDFVPQVRHAAAAALLRIDALR